MVTLEAVIARVTALRAESMQTGVASPNRERPEFAYGELCGRDSAFALVLEELLELLAQQERELKEDE